MGFLLHDETKLEELSLGFSNHSGGILDGCVLALDGLGVSTCAPYRTEVIHLKDYRFRKSGFAIIVLAGCDINARFISASCNHSGSTNDIIAWQDTLLFQMLEVEKQLPSMYFFIGDEVLNTTQQFLSPWPGKCILLLCNNKILIICFMVLTECSADCQDVDSISVRIHLTIGYLTLGRQLSMH
jgi:hypothetical protein